MTAKMVFVCLLSSSWSTVAYLDLSDNEKEWDFVRKQKDLGYLIFYSFDIRWSLQKIPIYRPPRGGLSFGGCIGSN